MTREEWFEEEECRMTVGRNFAPQMDVAMVYTYVKKGEERVSQKGEEQTDVSRPLPSMSPKMGGSVKWSFKTENSCRMFVG